MDFYLILGVDRSVSRADMERAYTRLARRYHPDINPGDTEAEAFFRRVTEAYETLHDPERRQEYDSGSLTANVTQGTSVEFSGFDFSTPATGASVTFGELFADVLPRTADVTGQREKGSDLYGEISLSFEDALRGVERQLTITRLDVCSTCGGSGVRRAEETRCKHCGGRGSAEWRRGHMLFSKACHHCDGSGRQRKRPCSNCRAEGTIPINEKITIQVPAGVADGSRMRVPSKGNVGPGGQVVGDLYITAKVDRHRFFEREGDDLLIRVPIGVHEAALGSTISVPTVGSAAQVEIPAGTESGAIFRLPAYGFPSPRTGRRGDLLVSVYIVLPAIRDKRSKELLREFGQLNPVDVRKNVFKE